MISFRRLQWHDEKPPTLATRTFVISLQPATPWNTTACRKPTGNEMRWEEKKNNYKNYSIV